MARSRNIKPALFDNELLGTAEPLLTLLFVGLWCLADREGRLEDRPLKIKAQIFPYRANVDITVMLQWLNDQGFIRRYGVGGVGYIDIPKFKNHQSPHHTERGSVIPEFPIESDGCNLTVKTPLVNASSTVEIPLIPDSLIPDSGILKPDSPAPPSRRKQSDLDYSGWPGIPAAQVLEDWLAMRKRIKADVCQTVVDRFGKQFHLAAAEGYTVDDCLSECIVKNWRGFKFSWLKNQEASNGKNRHSVKPSRSEQFDAAFDAAFPNEARAIEGDFERIGDYGTPE